MGARIRGFACRLGRSRVGLLVAIAALVVGVGTVHAAEPPFPYPSPAFDFAHPGSPHGAAFSVAAGTQTIPLLVVYGTFTDVPETSGLTAASIAQLIFPIGTAGTIADYFSVASGGRFRFVPAQESQGTVNDGVVQASLGTSAAFEALFPSPGFPAQGQVVVQAADPFVNFKSFDTNGDNKITPNELAILSIKTSRTPADNCGVTNGIASVTLDGVDLSTDSWSDTVTFSNEMTIAHELAHLELGTKDNSYTSGSFDILGPTCGAPRTDFWLPNSYNELHWGWVKPTVVSRDGYYNVSPGSPYLLYDPDRGTNDYFLVENRETAPYDANRSDSGLVIWQVDDTKWGTSRGAFELIRPGAATPPGNNYSGASTDAWDPSDPATPQRSMTSPWGDGTPAKVAVRAIGDAGTTMRAYFDVRGPGVLVDTYALAHAAPVNITLGTPGAISFPVMNTGEQTGTFAFTITGLPAGWTATTDTQTLAAGAASTANVTVTPPISASAGLYVLSAIGTNTGDASVSTTSSFTVNVVRRPTTIAYTGDLTGDYHDPAHLSAVLTDTLTGAPLGSRSLHFALGSQTADQPTAGNGVASTSIVITQIPASVPLVASFAGDPTYLPSSDSETFVITREETTTTYTGPTVILQGAAGVTLAARLLEDGAVPPVPSGQAVTLSVGGQSCVGTVDAGGVAQCTLTFTGPLGPEPVKAIFDGDAYYLPSSDTTKTAIVFAFPARGAFVVGDMTAAAGLGPVAWWGARWSSRNVLRGGPAPAAFKGFADDPVGLPTSSPVGTCSGTWSTGPGNSSKPVGDVPAYMGVLVAPSADKSGATVAGTYSAIVVVRTDRGYAPDPGHAGTGAIVATFCGS